MKEDSSLWKQVILSIHGSNFFTWHTAGKEGVSLRSPWLSISCLWLKVERLATFKLGVGNRIAFWLDTWTKFAPFSIWFSRLFQIATLRNGSVANHWDSSTNSWAISFRRLLKENEVEDFQDLMGIFREKRISSSQDRRVWSLESNGLYTVKSLVKHLSRPHH